jgi:septum site-determining protein MinD
MGDSIVISSGKGGVGKTNVAINLGIALAELWKNVVVVDASLTTPDISLQLGIPFNVKNLSHVLKENCDFKEAIFIHKSGVKFIPGNMHVDILKEFEGKKFFRILNKIKKENDFVLVDCAAGLGREAISAIKGCDKMLTVINPELASVVNSSKATHIAKSLNVDTIGIIINRVCKHKHELNEKDIMKILHNAPIIGRIPENEDMLEGNKKGEAIINYHPESNTSQEFRNIAIRLSKEKGKPGEIKKSWMFIKSPKDNSFKLKNGRELMCIKDLVMALESMEDETFNHHVNNDKNDFSNWIKDAIGHKRLGERIKNMRTKPELLDILKKIV